MSWLMKWRQRWECMHHEPPIHSIDVPAHSFVVSTLIDLGRRKMFTCTRCGRKWFT